MTESDLLKRLKEGIKTNAELFELLQEKPPDNWITESLEIPGYKFVNIEKVEMMLWKIFGFNHRIEITDHKEVFSSVSVAVKVWYKDFDNNEWNYFSGIAAEEPEYISEEGKEPITKYGIASALPTAKSNAIKNACLNFGALFGNSLNRNRPQTSQETKQSNANMLAELTKLLAEKRDKIKYEDQLHYDRIIEEKESENYAKSIRELKTIK